MDKNKFLISHVAGGGSARNYYRLQTPESKCLICISEDTNENVAFVRLTEYLKMKGVNVPEIYSVSEDKTSYLLEDLGDRNLLDFILQERPREVLWDVLEKVISGLVYIQTLPPAEWGTIVDFEPFGKELIEFDLNYVKVNFFEALKIGYDEWLLKKEFEKLRDTLLSYPQENRGLMYRDFQSRNILLVDSENTPYYIDYQSARKGPGIYDLVSFAWQAKAAFSTAERERVTEIYIKEYGKRGIYIEKAVKENIEYFAIFRILQTLGAYGRRGLKEGKRHFIESIPYAVENLSFLLEKENMAREFPELHHLIEKIRSGAIPLSED